MTQYNGYFYAEWGTVYFKVIEPPMLSIKVAFADEGEAIKLADQLNHDLGLSSIAQRDRASFCKGEVK